jgi:hypothetical protein
VRATPDQIASFATLPGVVAVKGVRTYHLDNAHSVPFIGAPQVWQSPPGDRGRLQSRLRHQHAASRPGAVWS